MHNPAWCRIIKGMNDAIAAAVKTLSAAPITNTRIREVFADLLPAEYDLGVQRGHWTIQGPAGTLWYRDIPVQPGKGLAIITELIGAAWAHATTTGHSGKTRAQQTAEGMAALRAMPICPECGQKVLPRDAAVSSVAGHHRDCA